MSDGLFDPPIGSAERSEAFGGGSAVGGAAAPLAVRMRPATLDEVVGQAHLLGP